MALKLEQNIIQIYDNLVKGDSKSIKTNVLKLEKLILTKKFTSTYENKIINSKEIKRRLPKFQAFYELFETDLERDFTRKIISGKVKKVNKYLLYNRFVTLVKNEIYLGKISKKDKVLVIGGGPFPITAILLNKFKACHVDCYDKNRKFVEISKKVISKLGLSKSIKIYNKKGESLGKNVYSVVIIVLLAKPKSKILKRVWKKTIPGTRIICRTSDGIRQIFYKQTNPNLFKYYKIVEKTYAKGDQTISPVLLIKK